MKVNLKAISIAVAMCFSQVGWAATFTYVAPSQGMPSPTQVGTFEETATGANVPANQVVGTDHSIGTLTLGDSVTKVFSFKHSVNKNIYNIAATVDYAGSNDISTQIKCTPPLTLTSADAEEVCDAYVTYSAYSNTYDPEFFTIKLKGYGSSTEYVAGSFMFSATVTDAASVSSSLAFDRTAQDINMAALLVGDYAENSSTYPTRTVTVVNSGSGEATGLVVSLDTDPRFSLSNNSCTGTLLASSSCSFDLTFTPTAQDVPDSYYSSVSVTYADQGNPSVISSAISGVVLAPGALTFVTTSEDPTSNLYSFPYSKIVNGVQTTFKTITILNDTDNEVTGVYPQLTLAPDQYFKSSQLFTITDSSCGQPGISSEQYDPKTGETNTVTTPPITVTLAPHSSCDIQVFMDIDNLVYGDGYQSSAPLTAVSDSGNTTANLTASLNLLSGPRLAVAYAMNASSSIDINFDASVGSDTYTTGGNYLINLGDATAVNTIPTVTGSDFTLWDNGCGSQAYDYTYNGQTFTQPAYYASVDPLSTCHVGISFTPSSLTNGYTANGSVTINSSGTPVTIPITGTVSGVVPSGSMALTRVTDIPTTSYNTTSGAWGSGLLPLYLYNYDFNNEARGDGNFGAVLFSLASDGTDAITINSISVVTTAGQQREIVNPSATLYNPSLVTTACTTNTPYRTKYDLNVGGWVGDTYYYTDNFNNACFLAVGYSPNVGGGYDFTVTINATTSAGTPLTTSSHVSGTWTGVGNSQY